MVYFRAVPERFAPARFVGLIFMRNQRVISVMSTRIAEARGRLRLERERLVNEKEIRSASRDSPCLFKRNARCRRRKLETERHFIAKSCLQTHE